MYIVEVSSFGGDLVAAMSNMRNWLDARRSQPLIISQLTGAGAMLRLEFRSEGEAAAFVGTFGGRLIRPERKAA